VELNVLPPVDGFDAVPLFLVNETGLLKVVRCVKILAEFTINTALTIGPPEPLPNAVDEPLQKTVPLVAATVPATKLVFPLTENVKALIFSTPLFMVTLLTDMLVGITQLLLPLTIITLSIVPGMPLGVQFVATVQDVDDEPFQV